MTDETNANEAQAAGGPASVNCLSQYVKDLSFENPNAVTASLDEGGAPDVSMNINVGVTRMNESVHEVTLSISGKAIRDDKHLFMVEMDYAGLFALENIPADHVEPVLFVHCTTLLFPFARQIVAEVTRNGGYPPLLLNAVDFGQLYQQQIAARGTNGDATA
jgi:preprotein translocase subunit SecB